MSFHVRSSETIPVIPFRGTKKKFGALFRSMTDWFCSFYYNFINNNNRMETCCKFLIKKIVQRNSVLPGKLFAAYSTLQFFSIGVNLHMFEQCVFRTKHFGTF